MTGLRTGFLLLALCALAASNAGAQAPARPDSAVLALGKKLFESKGLCFTCHGAAGEGSLGPTTRLAGRPFTHTKGTVAEIVALIKEGVSAERSTSKQTMPARGGSRLTDREVELVAAYVKHLNTTQATNTK